MKAGCKKEREMWKSKEDLKEEKRGRWVAGLQLSLENGEVDVNLDVDVNVDVDDGSGGSWVLKMGRRHEAAAETYPGLAVKTWPPENLSFKTQPLKNSSQLKHDPSEISCLKHSPSKTPLLKHGPLKISLFWRQPQIVVVKFQFCKSSTCWNCVQGAEALEENYSDHLGKYLMAAHRVFLSVPILKIIKYQKINIGLVLVTLGGQ